MYERELEIICRTAREAGTIIMEYYSGKKFCVREKDDRSPVTEADCCSDEFIRKALSEEFSCPILSEEAADSSERLNSDCCFIVDPLDGTKEFINGNGEFAVNIALCRGKRIVAGAVFIPVLEELYFAAEGCGAFREKDGKIEPLKVSSRTQNPRLVISRSHRTKDDDLLIQKLGITQIMETGSSIKGCIVARGDAEIYFRCGNTKEWDVAPVQIIIEEAGGIMKKIDGSEIVYNKENPLNTAFFASNGKVFPQKSQGKQYSVP
jgi:3'(2'), 5'-bisphosphate nucleotidase